MNTGCTSLTLSMQFWTELVKQAEIDVETLLPYLFLQLIGRLASSHDCLVMWPILVTPVWGRRVQNQPTLVLLELSALLQFCLTLHNCGYWFWLYPKNICSYFLLFTCSDEGHCKNESTVLYHRFWSIKKHIMLPALSSITKPTILRLVKYTMQFLGNEEKKNTPSSS